MGVPQRAVCGLTLDAVRICCSHTSRATYDAAGQARVTCDSPFQGRQNGDTPKVENWCSHLSRQDRLIERPEQHHGSSETQTIRPAKLNGNETWSRILLKYPIPKLLERIGIVRSLFDFAARFESGGNMKMHESLFFCDWMYATRHAVAFPVSEAG
jgi:hypothetical protein